MTAESDREIDAGELADELAARLRDTCHELAPWLLRVMPTAYFQDMERLRILAHLGAVASARASGLPPRLTLKEDEGDVWTLIHERDFPGLLAALVAQLPEDRPLHEAKAYTARDGSLAIDVFRFAEPVASSEAARREAAEELARAVRAGEPDAEAALARHIEAASPGYLERAPLDRALATFRACRELVGTDDSRVSFSDAEGDRRRVDLVCSRRDGRRVFERAVAHLPELGIGIHRAYLDRFDYGADGAVTAMGFIVAAELDADSEQGRRVARDLLRLPWVDERALDLLERHEDLDLPRAEVLGALCNLAHVILGREDIHAYSLERLLRLASRHLDLAAGIAALFSERFHPEHPLSDDEHARRLAPLRAEIDDAVDDRSARRFLHVVADATRACLRTNLHRPERYGLALRLDPSLFSRDDHPEEPFGVFFVHGYGFDGVHVRFRDVARGGMRVVSSLGAEEHARESVRLYGEAYDLALAQELKNKDIPEGGAKAVVLLEPGTSIDVAAKAFVDGLLDLLVDEPRVRRAAVSGADCGELIYLGPDENVSPDLIEWIVDRARARGYATPEAIMSSKPGAGISHKEYGVTSEGVVVFLERALREVGIDPRHEPFTLKMTGGPDGDVGGNLIKILFREFGDHPRIVAIADGSGSARDPEGLPRDELLRLVSASRPIAELDASALGADGRVVPATDRIGRRVRNTLHNEIDADAFVPAGGRPATIDGTNWTEYVKGERPASRVIVEGANLFLTPEARARLSERGVLVVKDSSANKCGVICSSFEIAASMVLGADELVEVKPRLVQEVLVKLRELARLEAELLFREHLRRRERPLPDLSVELSRAMLRATDAIERELSGLSAGESESLEALVLEHLPPVVLERAGPDRIAERIPARYARGIVAASLATRIVYREGMSYLSSLRDDELCETALSYVRAERENRALLAALEASQLPQRDRIAALLREGGVRSALAVDARPPKPD